MRSDTAHLASARHEGRAAPELLRFRSAIATIREYWGVVKWTWLRRRLRPVVRRGRGIGGASLRQAADTQSSPISSVGALWVIQPTEMRSTPVAAIPAAVSRVTRPEASVTALPATIPTASLS